LVTISWTPGEFTLEPATWVAGGLSAEAIAHRLWKVHGIRGAYMGRRGTPKRILERAGWN
jgi:hypothetical protein